ncbi:hypothetical protein CVT24_011629 [Panaeolus cyanescens]|uniref:Uncharacterized protein n=1 Tax=Panaeolus cyanescens TaxID=181874 RepID=A0A409YGZ0_9AGAR|nr:hypothetical protein CVT24_011629 [Panaeolus cyanescens]
MSTVTYHLRPVTDHHSPSPTPAESHHYKHRSSTPPTTTSNNRSMRRPLSPGSLPHVDLTQTSDIAPRKYPAPPTGHDLMAMFPPAPPDNMPEMRPGPTSGFFQRQERAFFAQAGKEIVRVRVEVDMPHGSEPEPVKSRNANVNRQWLNNNAPPGPHHSPVQSTSNAPILYPHPQTRPPQRNVVPVTPAPLFPITSSHPPSAQLPPNHLSQGIHQSRTPPQEGIPSGPPSSKGDYPTESEYDDESWRRPMPYAERRRAGKHTRRVIVR